MKEEVIKIYIKYSGDSDALSHSASTSEKLKISYQDWKELDALVQGLKLINNDMVSIEFKNDFKKKLDKLNLNPKDISALKKIASK